MYLSLKGSLGHTPITDRVGEGPLQIAEGAAAAYSLRNLGSDSPSVVRVRRESDNNERDFTAQDISTSVLTNWVNEQITPPLDLRELTATGRDGPIIEAAAAYSLRNLSDSYAGDVVEVRRNTDGALKDFKASEVTDGTLAAWVNTSFANALPLDTAGAAAAAYSLRNLSSSYTGSVVEVRRSSDGEPRSFTATEVTDGTLVTWVNEDVVKYSSDFSSSLDGFSVDSGDTALAGQTFEGESDVLKHTPSGSQSSAHRIRRLSIIPSSSIVSLKVLVYIPSSNTVVNGAQIRNVAADVFADTNTTDEWVEVEATGTSGSVGSSTTLAIHATSGGTRTFTGNGTDAIYYKNVSVTVTAADGTVSKWYDQSGNDKHATQGTPASQPKIVSGGALVTQGGLAAINFDSSSKHFNMASIGFGNTWSMFAVINATGLNSKILSQSSSSGGAPRIDLEQGSPDQFEIVSNSYAGADKMNLAGNINTMALTSLIDSANSFTAFTNGLPSSENPTTINGSFTFSVIGSQAAQVHQELILYNSDESDKRSAIEENIGSNYGLTLTSSKDGTVSKWYDQSTTSGVPNANHAVQTDATRQPKIVSGGSLVTGGLDFDGDFLSPSLLLPTIQNSFVTSVVTRRNTSTGYIAQLNRSSDRFYLRGALITLGDPAVNINTTLGNNEQSILSVTATAAGLFTGFKDGTSLGTTTYTGNVGGGDSTIGATNTGGTGFDGLIAEFIVYRSDQTDNRTALEANIGEVYGIAGIPAYDDTVNGFVETWYDQSGNGNDATQLTAGSQPKIVSGGVYLGEVDFLNGTSTFLETNNSDLANLSELSLFSVLEPVTASINEFAISAGSIVNSTGNYGGWAIWANGYANRLDFTTQARGSGTNRSAKKDITSTSPVVYSAILNGTDGQGSVNGVLGIENTIMITPNNTDANRRKLRLGCQYTFAPASFYSGAMKEVILYTSDQTANRPAIEANINNQYDIY